MTKPKPEEEPEPKWPEPSAHAGAVGLAEPDVSPHAEAPSATGPEEPSNRTSIAPLLPLIDVDPRERATSVWYRIAGLINRKQKDLAIDIIEGTRALGRRRFSAPLGVHFVSGP